MIEGIPSFGSFNYLLLILINYMNSIVTRLKNVVILKIHPKAIFKISKKWKFLMWRIVVLIYFWV